ncbi:MAG: hypothetical protein B7X33_01625 [Lysobacterales bacterium 13-68-4]|nr:MAG: hypothetical protein B7X33_01625 [Xanthomonadales bacterium 13-68-4]
MEVYRGATWSQPATDMLEDALLRGFEDSGRIGAVARRSVHHISDSSSTVETTVTTQPRSIQ